MRKIGVEALSAASARTLLASPDQGFTVVEFPKPSGGKRNHAYESYLSEKDANDLVFYLCMTSPSLAIADLYEFFAAFLDHGVRGTARVLGFENSWVGVGKPFSTIWDMSYLRLLRKVVKDHATFPEQLLQAVEDDFHGSLIRRDILPSRLKVQKEFRSWLRKSMLGFFDGQEKAERNIGAHIFKDLLTTGGNTLKCEFPEAHNDAIKDDARLGKKILLLTHLETKGREGLIEELPMISMRLVRAYMSEKVVAGRDVQFRTMRVSVPAIAPSEKETLVLP